MPLVSIGNNPVFLFFLLPLFGEHSGNEVVVIDLNKDEAKKKIDDAEWKWVLEIWVFNSKRFVCVRICL